MTTQPKIDVSKLVKAVWHKTGIKRDKPVYRAF